MAYIRQMKKNKFSLRRQEKPSRLFDVTNHSLILWVFVSLVALHCCLARLRRNHLLTNYAKIHYKFVSARAKNHGLQSNWSLLFISELWMKMNFRQEFKKTKQQSRYSNWILFQIFNFEFDANNCHLIYLYFQDPVCDWKDIIQ
jgi:hypothetical protein